MWPIESNYSFNVYEKPKPQSTGSTVAGEAANSLGGLDTTCPTCGDYHEPDKIPRECETGDLC